MINPYASGPVLDEDVAPATAVDPLTPDYPSLLRTCVRWIFVCVVAAAPSFILGYGVTNDRIAGMLAAVVSFILLYIAADLMTRQWPIRKQAAVRRTLVSVYVIRVLASIVFPVGLIVDIPTGMVMFWIVSLGRFEDRMPFNSMNELAAFWLAYRMTCVHAVLMNLLLAALGLLLYPVIAFFTHRTQRWDPSNGSAGRFEPEPPPAHVRGYWQDSR